MDLCGSWRLESCDNFEKFLHGCGVNRILAKLATTLTPTETISINDDQWTIKTATKVKTSSFTFRLNEPFDEETMDGRKVKSTASLEITNEEEERITKLTQIQKNKSGDTITIVRITRIRGGKLVKGDVLEVQMRIHDIQSNATFRRI